MSAPLPPGLSIITGAASGIGRALACQLAARGEQLALCDRDEARLGETVVLARNAALQAQPGAPVPLVSAHLLDVGDAQAIAALPGAVRTLHERGVAQALLPRPLRLYNNAGVALAGQFSQLSDDEFEWLMGINFRGVVRMTRAFLPLLQAAPSAHLVNTSSVFGLIGPPGQTAYASAKFAVRGFTDALRHELSGSRVRVVCVHPGGIRTQIAHSARLGQATGISASQLQAAADQFVRMAPTTAEQAATRILRGLDRGELRIRIGADAVFIDRLARLLPVRYWGVIRRRWQGSGLGAGQAAAGASAGPSAGSAAVSGTAPAAAPSALVGQDPA